MHAHISIFPTAASQSKAAAILSGDRVDVTVDAVARIFAKATSSNRIYTQLESLHRENDLKLRTSLHEKTFQSTWR